MAQVDRQAVDHLRAPAVFLLARQDIPADLPVEQHQFAVHGERCADLGVSNALLQIAQKLRVTLRLKSLFLCHRFPPTRERDPVIGLFHLPPAAVFAGASPPPGDPQPPGFIFVIGARMPHDRR
jgi:hypothetical protein